MDHGNRAVQMEASLGMHGYVVTSSFSEGFNVPFGLSYHEVGIEDKIGQRPDVCYEF
jgi:hypothetical protein